MKERLIESILYEMNGILSKKQLDTLNSVLKRNLSDVSVEYEKDCNDNDNQSVLLTFINAKKVEGLSNKTLNYYLNTLKALLDWLNKPLRLVTTEDLRAYITNLQQRNNSSNVTMDNVRRIISTFFTWMEEEDYVIKSPARRIHRIKCEKTVKSTISDEELVILKDACTNSRDLALIEILSSTGIRVGELVQLNISDINFNERSCIVIGKGNKQREVYFDAKTKIHLNEYLKSRKDDSTALFVSLNSPNKRLTISGVEQIVKKIGESVGLNKIHPHKFRRTMATYAIDKGMPIEQVQTLLGHVKIDTTLSYAMVNQNNVKLSHRKFIS